MDNESIDLLSGLLVQLLAVQDSVLEHCPACGSRLRPGGLLIDHSVFNDDRRQIGQSRLSPLEWRVLSALRRRFERMCSRDFLVDSAWPMGCAPDTAHDEMKVIVYRIRGALDRAAAPYHVYCCWGEGYMLRPGAAVHKHRGWRLHERIDA